METYTKHLDWLDDQRDAMIALTTHLANINSGTLNLPGLEQMADEVEAVLTPICDSVARRKVGHYETVNSHGEVENLPLGEAICGVRRPEAERRVLLSIHLDTVYETTSAFQQVQRLDDDRLGGPGVADAKGGLVVMLYALRAFERFVEATGHDAWGWDVLLNADEEIGSPGSAELFREYAEQADFGLLFEPSLPGGELISGRRGSGNFSLVTRGRAAHAGRAFHSGRNAVAAAAEVARELHRLNGRWPGVTLNVARIDGGGPYNMVPETAVVRFNIRYEAHAAEHEISETIREIAERTAHDGIRCELHGRFSAPPKPVDPPLEQLLGQIAACGALLDCPIAWQPSGGVCDGNRLAAYGLTNVDTLGVRGGGIHSAEEYALCSSFPERARLTALLLMKMADGTLDPPGELSDAN